MLRTFTRLLRHVHIYSIQTKVNAHGLSPDPGPLSIALTTYYFIIKNREDLRANAIILPLTTLVAIVVAGLSFLADIFNIDMNNDKILYAAIGEFLTAHLEYAATFTYFNGFH